MLSKEQLSEQLYSLGIRPGMNLLVHSSLRKIGKVEGGADTVIDVLDELLGPDGVLLMSTVSGNVNPEQPVFHVVYTPSTVGALSNVFRVRPGVTRSLHPVHSVAARGPRAEFFTQGHLEAPTPWSPESPYGKLMRNDGFILFLGTNFVCNTCIHALEIEAEVSGLHTRESQTLYVCDYDNKWHTTEHHWHAPKADNYADMENVVQAAGGLRYGMAGDGCCRLCDSKILRKTLLPILRSNPERVIRRLSDSNFVWR